LKFWTIYKNISISIQHKFNENELSLKGQSDGIIKYYCLYVTCCIYFSSSCWCILRKYTPEYRTFSCSTKNSYHIINHMYYLYSSITVNIRLLSPILKFSNET